jgi:hypothetical protein
MGRRFCVETEVWRKELAAIDIVASQTQYGLDPAEVTDAESAQPEPEIRKLVWAKISGSVQDAATYELVKYTGAAVSGTYAQTPQYAVEFLEDYVPTSAITGGLEVKVVLVPNWNSSYISDFILSAYGFPIAAGAMADMMLMPGKPWYNPDRAAYHFDLWGRGVTDAVKERYAGRNSVSLRVNLTPWI